MSELPNGLWENLSIDFFGPTPSRTELFVLIDDFSRFPIVRESKGVKYLELILRSTDLELGQDSKFEKARANDRKAKMERKNV